MLHHFFVISSDVAPSITNKTWAHHCGYCQAPTSVDDVARVVPSSLGEASREESPADEVEGARFRLRRADSLGFQRAVAFTQSLR